MQYISCNTVFCFLSTFAQILPAFSISCVHAEQTMRMLFLVFIYSHLQYGGIFLSLPTFTFQLYFKVWHGLSYPWDATSMIVHKFNLFIPISEGFLTTPLLGTQQKSFARPRRPNLLRLEVEKKTRRLLVQSETKATLPRRFTSGWD